jgi:DNA-binding transcriptional MerR regulator
MANDPKARWYQTGEFAELTGVTVRALHHYDRVGLLPARRTAAGYRLYDPRHAARLEQIVALKFIGFSLKEIKKILEEGQTRDLANMLRVQREVIARKRSQFDKAIRAIRRAEAVVSKQGRLDLETLKQIIDAMNEEAYMDWMMQYYSEEARRKIAERAKDWTAEKQKQLSADWAALFEQIDAAIAEGVDPASERARQLAARWDELVGRFTGGDPEVAAGLKKLYADQANWPATFQKPFNDQQAAFVNLARAHGDNES